MALSSGTRSLLLLCARHERWALFPFVLMLIQQMFRNCFLVVASLHTDRVGTTQTTFRSKPHQKTMDVSPCICGSESLSVRTGNGISISFLQKFCHHRIGGKKEVQVQLASATITQFLFNCYCPVWEPWHFSKTSSSFISPKARPALWSPRKTKCELAPTSRSLSFHLLLPKPLLPPSGGSSPCSAVHTPARARPPSSSATWNSS